jgi:hypothetical protein
VDPHLTQRNASSDTSRPPSYDIAVNQPFAQEMESLNSDPNGLVNSPTSSNTAVLKDDDGDDDDDAQSPSHTSHLETEDSCSSLFFPL